ncbi:ribonuclease E inhibitor RraB [Acinetobacter larvae]|uniref:Regulator of ribonuclease activity B domain-containing protein n=1 Tax=Acinetobacter larvae TaxID=1789224 RepID=A0A1B2LXA9_9GAMM|nr:ribonuclease E inhibitor RraB [Acinetobacter larvae]AOA57519.1 hypothetical protein BFG52_03560 [Acinetobacter larvae]
MNNNVEQNLERNDLQFPADENGELLWQMYLDGNDLSEVHQIEFSLLFTDQKKLEQCALFLLHEEQKLAFFEDDVQPELWVLTVFVDMVPDHEDITALEQWFIGIAAQHGAEYDGWGCVGYIYEFDQDEDEYSN